MPATDASWHILIPVMSFQCFLILSDVYAQMLVTHKTSKMYTCGSQAIAIPLSTYTLKSQQFPLICNNPLWLYISCELLTLSISLTFLSIPMHRGLEISVCPPYNYVFHVLCYLIYPILVPDHYLRSLPSHCPAYSLPIALLIPFPLQGIVSCIWFFITYAHFLWLCLIGCQWDLPRESLHTFILYITSYPQCILEFEYCLECQWWIQVLSSSQQSCVNIGGNQYIYQGPHLLIVMLLD
jgi:hypothetical protein